MAEGRNNRTSSSQLQKNPTHERIKRQTKPQQVKKSEIRHKAPNVEKRKKRIPLKPEKEILVDVGEMDYVLLFVIIALTLIGIIMVFSASSYQSAVEFGNPYTFFIKQAIFATIGMIGLVFTANFHYNNLRERWPMILYITSVILLVLVLFFGVKVNGAKRWLEIPGTGFRFQPSEIAKIAIILMVSSIIAKKPRILETLGGTVYVGSFIMLLAILIGVENMSTALIILLVGFAIVFVVSPYTKRLIALGFAGVALVAGYLAYEYLFGDGFRGGRVEAWIDPFSDMIDDGFQTVQSLYAVASGGFFGLGLGNSRQKLSYIPESHNDIIFAIICEELGFLGAAIIIGLYMVLIYRGVQIAIKAPNLFGTLLAFGLVVWIAVQAIINIAVVTNTIPNTGIALPFISYGGTSLVFMITSMGILLNISRYTRR